VVQSRSPSYFQMGRRDIGSHIIATGGYPLWYEIALPLGSVFAWAIALWYVAGRLPASSVQPARSHVANSQRRSS